MCFFDMERFVHKFVSPRSDLYDEILKRLRKDVRHLKEDVRRLKMDLRHLRGACEAVKGM